MLNLCSTKMNLDIRCIISILYRRVLIKLRSSRWTWWSRRTILTLGSRLCYFVRAQCYLASSYWSIYIYIYIYIRPVTGSEITVYIYPAVQVYIYIYIPGLQGRPHQSVPKMLAPFMVPSVYGTETTGSGCYRNQWNVVWCSPERSVLRNEPMF